MDKQIYSQDYRHFDTLIWQVQAWASAIFALTISATSAIVPNISKIEQTLPIDALRALSIFLSVVFVVLMLLSNTLVRFRVHQGALGELPTPRLPRPWWQLPGQTSLLLIVYLEATAILLFALITWGVSPSAATVVSLLFLGVAFTITERWTRGTYRTVRRNARPPSDDG